MSHANKGADGQFPHFMKTKFTIAGALVGALVGIGVMLVAYVKGPGHPGFYEVLVQIAMVAALAVPTALMGFVIGWIVSLIVKKEET